MSRSKFEMNRETIGQLTLQLSVVYDNNPYDPRLKAGWGFSCFVEGLEKSILFDTGGDAHILLFNLEKLGIQPAGIEVVMLSHMHKDHTGGLENLLVQNPGIEVWLPYFFPSDFKEGIFKKGARVVEVETSRKICNGAHSSGVIEGWIKEQSLVLETEKGLVLMTGCAHPRIVRIIDRVRELFEKDIFMALGGFHLAGFEKREIREIIRKFRDSGIKKVSPAHCSGDETRRLFQEEYQDDFIMAGVGTRIEI
jgi:7,8-dihydropterin-6-yl-methyl-4-(beta-D-ribofuranosyl)aminobenzene 5'-phosphate synthase